MKWVQLSQAGIEHRTSRPNSLSLFPHLCPASQIMLNRNLLDGFSGNPRTFFTRCLPGPPDIHPDKL